MLSSETRPFDLEPAQIVLRLTSSTLLATMNTMMLRGTSSQTVHPLTSGELGDFQVALAPESATAEHPWLGRAARCEVDLPEDAAAVTEYMQLESEVHISTATYADGQPATHVPVGLRARQPALQALGYCSTTMYELRTTSYRYKKRD